MTTTKVHKQFRSTFPKLQKCDSSFASSSTYSRNEAETFLTTINNVRFSKADVYWIAISIILRAGFLSTYWRTIEPAGKSKAQTVIRSSSRFAIRPRCFEALRDFGPSRFCPVARTAWNWGMKTRLSRISTIRPRTRTLPHSVLGPFLCWSVRYLRAAICPREASFDSSHNG